MWGSIEKLIEKFLGLFADISVRGRRNIFVSIFILFLILMVFLDNQVSYTRFLFLERKIAILKELNSLAQDGITQNNELNAIYLDLVKEVSEQEYFPILGYTSSLQPVAIVRLFSSVEVWKFISGVSFGFIFVAIIFFQRENNEKWRSTAVAAFIFGLIGGIVGLYLPVFYRPWVNYIIYPFVVQPVFLFMLGRLFSKKG